MFTLLKVLKERRQCTKLSQIYIFFRLIVKLKPVMCCFCFWLKVLIIAQRPDHYVVEHTIATIVFPTENFNSAQNFQDFLPKKISTSLIA